MNDQLTIIRRVVVHTLNPDNHSELSTDKIKGLITELPDMGMRIYAAVRGTVYGFSKASVVERHVHQVQYDCISLMDILDGYPDFQAQALMLKNAVFDCLEGILKQIELNHTGLFDRQVLLPVCYFKLAMSDLKQEFLFLKALMKKHRTDLALQEPVLSCLSGFFEKNRCSCQELNYIKRLLLSLNSLKIESDHFNEILKKQLIYLGLNDLNLAEYYINSIEEELTGMYRADEQYEHLCRYQKQFKGQEERADDCFDPKRLSLKLILLEYVNAELDFLERKELIGRDQVPETRQIAESNYRVRISLSADGLAYFLRLMVEAEIIVAKPRTLLISFVSKYFQTNGIGSNSLSSGSLETKYKQVTQNTAKAVRMVLKRMLHQLDQQFFLGETK